MTSVPPVLRGELFKSGENNPAFKLRWFELFADGMLVWSEQPGSAAKGSFLLRDAIIGFETPVLKPTKSDSEGRFGLRVTPATSGRHYMLRASSEEERRVWAEAMDAAAHLVSAYRFGGVGRVVKMTKPPSGRLGIDLGSPPGTACVTVIKLGTEATAVQSRQPGLLVGDVIVAVDNTVLRTMAIADNAFGRIVPSSTMTLRLAGWNRELRMIKQGGVSGLTLCAPSAGTGVLVYSIAPHSAAAVAGLNVGDRVLAINSVHCAGHEQASDQIRSALQEVRLIVSGVTVGISLRKDTNGRIGLGFAKSSRLAEQGAVITDVLTRSAAAHAGLRNGDLLLAVDGELVNDPEAAIEILARAPRALNLVVWRSRPDPVPHDNYAPSAIGTGTSTGIPASSAGGESGVVGAVPWAYYAHSVLQGGIAEGGGCEAPPNVPLFEDLTVGDRI